MSGYRLLSGSIVHLSLTSCRFTAQWSSRALYGTTGEYITAMKHKKARLAGWNSGHKNLFHYYCRTVCHHGAFAVKFGAICCLCADSNSCSIV